MSIEDKDDGQPDPRQAHPGLQHNRTPPWRGPLPAGKEGERAEASLKDDRGATADNCTARALQFALGYDVPAHPRRSLRRFRADFVRVAGPRIERALGGDEENHAVACLALQAAG
jgi:hypothetical protein